MKRILAIAGVAVFTLTGGAVAASQITGSQIKNSTITGKDVKNRSLTRKDFNGSVRGATGPQGAPGAQGTAGPQGPAGPVALGGIVRVEGPITVIAPGDVDHATASCPAGYGLISGGFVYISSEGETFYEDDFGSGNSWTVGGDNIDASVTGDLNAIAYCAPSGQAVAASKSRRSKVRDRAAARDAAQRAAH